jgi:hypothetical protein
MASDADLEDRGNRTSSLETRFQIRKQELEARVAEVATALHERGVRPTVARVRSALGGGSPNDLAPALKLWRESTLLSASSSDSRETRTALPLQVADLVHELWQRATAAAVGQVRGGATARDAAARAGEAQVLRDQVVSLRDRLQRESLAYGELRAQAARHESIARAALARADASDSRERDLLRELGVLRQRISELEAQLEQRPTKIPFRSGRRLLAPAAAPKRRKRSRVRPRLRASQGKTPDKKRSRFLQRPRGRQGRS